MFLYCPLKLVVLVLKKPLIIALAIPYNQVKMTDHDLSIIAINEFVNGNFTMDNERPLIDQKAQGVRVTQSQRARLREIETAMETEAGCNVRASDVIEMLLDFYSKRLNKDNAPRVKITAKEQAYCNALVKELRKNNSVVRSMLDAILGQHLPN